MAFDTFVTLHVFMSIYFLNRFAIQTHLNHLRPSMHAFSIHHEGWGLREIGCVLTSKFHRSIVDQASADKHLSDEFRVSGVRNVVLADVALQPITEVEEFVVHADQYVGCEGWHVRQCPAVHFQAGYGNHFLCLPFVCSISVDAKYGGAQRAANKPNVGSRFMQESHFQRYVTVRAKVDGFDELFGTPFPKVKIVSVLSFSHVLRVEAFGEMFWMTPLCTHHDVMVWLVPEIIT